MNKVLDSYLNKLTKLQNERSMLDYQIQELNEKISLFADPPTDLINNLPKKFSIFEGLIKYFDSVQEYRDPGETNCAIPDYREATTIVFFNGSHVSYTLIDYYENGNDIFACINDSDDDEEISKKLAKILLKLGVRSSNSNIRKLVHLLEYFNDKIDRTNESGTHYSFSQLFSKFYKK